MPKTKFFAIFFALLLLTSHPLRAEVPLPQEKAELLDELKSLLEDDEEMPLYLGIQANFKEKSATYTLNGMSIDQLDQDTLDDLVSRAYSWQAQVQLRQEQERRRAQDAVRRPR